MKKIIADRWNGNCKEMEQSSGIVYGKEVDNLIRLSNGIWLRDFGHGRFVNKDNESERWAGVMAWDSDLNYKELIGFTCLD